MPIPPLVAPGSQGAPAILRPRFATMTSNSRAPPKWDPDHRRVPRSSGFFEATSRALCGLVGGWVRWHIT
eukprot:7333367-Pyramimonas_sp.AAC.1